MISKKYSWLSVAPAMLMHLLTMFIEWKLEYGWQDTL